MNTNVRGATLQLNANAIGFAGRSKFFRRTARNIVFRRRPYFVHLAVTHRCNLACSFCRIREERSDELALNGMQQVIDVLDAMGIAVVSIAGGGEPLLRRDLTAIVEYAAAKGLYVKVTSNGTLPRARYEELLASSVREIAISLDDVHGDDLPNSHVSPRILENIRFLNDNWTRGRQLMVNITVSARNVERIDEIARYCTRAFPRARLWLNPIVVGNGKLRVANQAKINPDFFPRAKTPTVLEPAYFKRACQEYYRSDVYDWGCLAGELFFAVKPNGDLWLCQDVPPASPLNVLDPDFLRKYRATQFSEQRRQCSGCTYSCYLGIQKAFERKCWRDVAVVWWKTVTEPDDPCRKTREERGLLAGMLQLGLQTLRSRTGAAPTDQAEAATKRDADPATDLCPKG